MASHLLRTLRLTQTWSSTLVEEGRGRISIGSRMVMVVGPATMEAMGVAVSFLLSVAIISMATKVVAGSGWGFGRVRSWLDRDRGGRGGYDFCCHVDD